MSLTLDTLSVNNIAETSADGNGEITALSGSYDLDAATFNQSENVPSNTSSIRFNNDGTRMFTVDNSGNFEQFDLSTPYDISTKTSSGTFTDSVTSTYSSLDFNASGTKMYFLWGTTSPATTSIKEYDLSTAFDITTATFLLEDFPSLKRVDVGNIEWNNDGTRLYYMIQDGGGSSDLYQFTASPAYDLSSLSTFISLTPQDSGALGFTFNDDGTKLFEIGFTTDLIYQYSLSTAFEINTATLDKSISTQGVDSIGIIFNDDGSKMYEVERDTATATYQVHESDVEYNATERGFVYSTTSRTDPGNTSPAASAYESVVNQTGTYGTGTFSLSLTGLSGGTTYYVRSYGQDTNGYVYGDEVSFTTESGFTQSARASHLMSM